MSRIEFAMVAGRLPHPEYGMHHSREFIRCDLARPSAELEAIAVLLSSIQPVDEAMVMDGVLYVGSDYRVPYLLQERALHRVLGIARQVLAEGLDMMVTERTKPTLRPEPSDETYCSRATAYVTGEDGRSYEMYAMPEGCYEPGVLVFDRAGSIEGHFLVSDRYDDTRRRLALPLLGMHVPEAGIARTGHDSRPDFTVRVRTADLEQIGAACLRVAGGMIAAMKDRVQRLQYEGHATAFLDEDNDARDVLLKLMSEGLVLTSTPNDEGRPGHSDAECRFRYWMDDGMEAPPHVVQRLLGAGLIHPADGVWGSSSTIVAARGLRQDDLQPRVRSVSFDMFQGACRFRRHPDDGEKECLSPDHHGYNSYCECESCPLLDRVYEKELGERMYSNRPIDEDPAFEFHLLNQRPDPLMVARHPGTRRSAAWRYAGIDRMHGVINQVLGSHLAYGIPMLVEAMHDAAIDQAVAEGWLVVRERSTLGSVAQVTDKLLGEVARQRQAREAAQADPTDA